MSDQRVLIREQDIQGIKQLKQLRPLMKRLHEVGCERDQAGNRTLHMDQYVMLVLLAFFNPIVTSLRGIQQASELKKVQRKLGCARASLGSLSEATQVFRSAELQAMVSEVAAQADALQGASRSSGIPQRLTAVDGTLLAKLPQITQAAWQSRRNPAGWRMHTQFEILRGTPIAIEITDGRNKGPSNEKHVLRHSLAADRCYVIDRGYEQFSLFNAIVAAQSSYVCRIRGDHHFAVETAREVLPAALKAGVIEDSVGQLGSPKSRRIKHPDHAVRLVRIRVEPHPKRGGRRRHAASQDIVLVTNLLDVPADIIAEMYRSRWQIEIFFRYFKHVLGCRHLLSEDPVGIEIQTYCGILVCLLIGLWTGKQATLRTYEMICLYMQGWADEEEVLAHVEKLKRQAS